MHGSAAGEPQIGFRMATVAPQPTPEPRPAVPRTLFLQLVFQSDLEPSTRLVLFAIAWSSRADGRGSFLSVPTVASRTGLGERRVQQLLAVARRVGWLGSEPRAGRTNSWVLTAPAEVHNPRTPLQGGVKPSSGGGELGFTHRKYLGRSQEGAVRAARRRWCGECEEQTRLVSDPEGANVRRCPKCHPLGGAAARH
jgi:hypothetical protein